MKSLVKVFNALSIIFLIILIFWIVVIDYKDLSFKNNISPYFGIFSMVLMLIAMEFIKRGIKKK
ncbi:conserved hypothetical protein [Tenacibaculum sp. 190524A05c]|uniref:hypothetical protein n=1 Tax=Tenacibaculum platacis TaxID=3137852 RepID=UPI0031FAD602